jgi:hypothetical protein
MDKTLIVYGYHGTSQTKAANILKHGFLASDNDYDWLGTGIYFFPTIAPTRPRSKAHRLDCSFLNYSTKLLSGQDFMIESVRAAFVATILEIDVNLTAS